MADEAVSAWHEPWTRTLIRWLTRHRTGVTALAAAVLAGVVGLMALAVQQARSNAALTKVNTATRLAAGRAQAEAERALQAEARARAEADKANAVNEFLTADLLTQAEPENNAVEDHVTLLEVLDRAAAKVGARFVGRPELEEALRRTIAKTYHGLSSWEKAEAHWRAVAESAGRHLGPDDASALEAEAEVGHILLHRGQMAEAIRRLEAASEGQARALGPDHSDTLSTRGSLANAYMAAGRHADAIRLQEEVLKAREARLGPDHPDTLRSRANLAAANWYAGRFADAIRLNLATLRAEEEKLGPDHPSTLNVRMNLAAAYLATRRYADAALLYEATLKAQEVRLGPDHDRTFMNRTNLALAYESLGRWADAEALLRENVTRHRKREKPGSLPLGSDLTTFGRNRLMQGKGSEAEPLLREALAIREKAMPDDYSRFLTMSLLGGALLNQGKYPEAEPLVVAGYEGIKAREAKIRASTKSLILPEAAERVVRLYEAWGKPDQARSWAERLGLADLPADVFDRP
jgi:tetratricopeptide (TPR) repeat protein